MLEGKKVVILGDRDGVPGQAAEEMIKTIAGAEVVYSTTECFVWTSAGAMDLENQARIKGFADQYGKDLVIVLGAGEAQAAELAAETVTQGDPTYAGPLAGVQLGLPVYHAFELKDSVDPGVYDDQAGMMEMVLDVDALIEAVKKYRA